MSDDPQTVLRLADDPARTPASVFLDPALAPQQRDAMLAGGREHVIRFRVPDGKTVFEDMVLGRVEFDNGELDDLVIVRRDGTPTYNFAVVVDDAAMASSVNALPTSGGDYSRGFA